MKLFGEHIKDLRCERNLPLRKVAAFLDIDTSVLSKIERGERAATREMAVKAADYFCVDEKSMLISFFSDQLAEIIFQENDCSDILKSTEVKIEYLKNKNVKQGILGFDNE